MARSALSWKVFRVICIIQMVLIAFQLMLSIVQVFYEPYLVNILKVIVYGIIFVFLYQGLSVLNYNYPNIPLTVRQKRIFNWLFIINVLLIAYLFAVVVSNWWVVPIFFNAEYRSGIAGINLFYLIGPFLLVALTFLFHLVFLEGMFQLRRAIHQNTIKGWYKQFEEGKQE